MIRTLQALPPIHPALNNPEVTLDELLAPCLAPDGFSADNSGPNPFDLVPVSGSSISPSLSLVRSLSWSTSTSCVAMAYLLNWNC